MLVKFCLVWVSNIGFFFASAMPCFWFMYVGMDTADESSLNLLFVFLHLHRTANKNNVDIQKTNEALL